MYLKYVKYTFLDITSFNLLTKHALYLVTRDCCHPSLPSALLPPGGAGRRRLLLLDDLGVRVEAGVLGLRGLEVGHELPLVGLQPITDQYCDYQPITAQ